MKNQNLEMKNYLSTIPAVIIRYIAEFSNPILFLSLSQNFKTCIFNNSFPKYIKIHFGWLPKLEIDNSNGNDIKLYKILIKYQSIVKKELSCNNYSFSFFYCTSLFELAKIIPMFCPDFKGAPQLTEKLFLESFLMHKGSAMNLFHLSKYYKKLQQLISDQKVHKERQDKIITFMKQALIVGFEQKHSVTKNLLISELSNLISDPSEKFQLLEKYYQYCSIHTRMKQFKIDFQAFRDLHQKWWNEMTDTVDLQDKLSRATGLLDLYNKFQHYNAIPSWLQSSIDEKIHFVSKEITKIKKLNPTQKSKPSAKSTSCLIC